MNEVWMVIEGLSSSLFKHEHLSVNCVLKKSFVLKMWMSWMYDLVEGDECEMMVELMRV